MAIAESYLMTTQNVEKFFNSLVNAQAPEKFTTKFLEQLEFTSSNDRLFIGVLKALGFIDGSGIPKDRYYKFMDQTESKKILAEAIKEAYEDLFAVNTKAYELSETEVKNKLKTITQGTKSDNVLRLMAKTFKALSDYADWTKSDIIKSKDESDTKTEVKAQDDKVKDSVSLKKAELHYNIQIHLPESRDSAVYDAIFKSLKEHLL